ncbi:uncharacterized protein EV422DRAFT_113804 [Fimicolochytrium jonesii]|uniref:uncharacterized protein n=1 Tax=Fimicolochytrium jonesii TaxID=1396493 RepID=UPI0022FEC55B|nr:uncharacterized protein EV422DRAFT_113804 [Fimicolochytrium jonesii]KAI8819460.1 hypothetical protein EV422DRAFT_113804 [Fimicolochytrium jonesii]
MASDSRPPPPPWTRRGPLLMSSRRGLSKLSSTWSLVVQLECFWRPSSVGSAFSKPWNLLSATAVVLSASRTGFNFASALSNLGKDAGLYTSNEVLQRHVKALSVLFLEIERHLRTKTTGPGRFFKDIMAAASIDQEIVDFNSDLTNLHSSLLVSLNVNIVEVMGTSDDVARQDEADAKADQDEYRRFLEDLMQNQQKMLLAMELQQILGRNAGSQKSGVQAERRDREKV